MNEILDDKTGQPFEPRGDKATGAARVLLVDPATNQPYAAGGGSDPATETTLEDVSGKLDSLLTLATNTNTLLATPANGLPPKARVPLSLAGAPDMVPVNFTNASPQTIEAADASLRWSIYGLLLSFSVAGATLTIEGGSEDLVIDIPNNGILDLADRELAYVTANVNQAMTLTVSTGTCKGVLYAMKQ